MNLSLINIPNARLLLEFRSLCCQGMVLTAALNAPPPELNQSTETPKIGCCWPCEGISSHPICPCNHPFAIHGVNAELEDGATQNKCNVQIGSYYTDASCLITTHSLMDPASVHLPTSLHPAQFQ